jgi:hypothetical protein
MNFQMFKFQKLVVWEDWIFNKRPFRRGDGVSFERLKKEEALPSLDYAWLCLWISRRDLTVHFVVDFEALELKIPDWKIEVSRSAIMVD